MEQISHWEQCKSHRWLSKKNGQLTIKLQSTEGTMSRNRPWSLKILELIDKHQGEKKERKRETSKAVRKKANDPRWEVWDARMIRKQRYKYEGKYKQMLNV